MRKLILTVPLTVLALSACHDNNGANTSYVPPPQTVTLSKLVDTILGYGDTETMQPLSINLLVIDSSDESPDTYSTYFATGT